LGPGAIDRAHKQLAHTVLSVCVTKNMHFTNKHSYLLLDKQQSVSELNTVEFSC